MTPDPFKPPPVLDYSTVSSEGLPKYHSQAEAMIYLGKPPDALCRFFEKPGDAVRYYAMSTSRRFDVTRLNDHCLLCGGTAMDRFVRVGWRAKLHLPAASNWPRLWRRDSVCGFTTLHSICVPCYREWRGLNRERTMWIISASALIALMICVSAVAALLQDAHLDVAFSGAFGGFVLLGIFTAIALERLAWRLPKAIRRMFPGSVVPSGDLELLRRPAAIPVAREGAT